MTQRKDNSNLPLYGKPIHIVGSNRLQNELMASVLDKELAARCKCWEEINHFFSLDEVKTGEKKLILLDCLGKELNKIIGLVESLDPGRKSLNIIALFNVMPNAGIEENMAAHGIRGVFYETDNLNKFLKGVTALFDGEVWLSREIMTRLVLKKEVFSPKVKDILTQREMEILSLIAVGAKNEEIAEKLFVSPNTVKTHIYNIFKKIKVTCKFTNYIHLTIRLSFSIKNTEGVALRPIC